MPLLENIPSVTSVLCGVKQTLVCHETEIEWPCLMPCMPCLMTQKHGLLHDALTIVNEHVLVVAEHVIVLFLHLMTAQLLQYVLDSLAKCSAGKPRGSEVGRADLV